MYALLISAVDKLVVILVILWEISRGSTDKLI